MFYMFIYFLIFFSYFFFLGGGGEGGEEEKGLLCLLFCLSFVCLLLVGWFLFSFIVSITELRIVPDN